MKKVRCLIGTVGAAVPVFGMVMPAAPAAAATHSAGPGTKTVSLRLAAATSSSSPASSPSRPGTTTTSSPLGASPSPATGSCTGTKGVHKTLTGSRPYEPSVSMKFWYRKSTHDTAVCIGTVEGQWNDMLGNSYDLRVRIWSGQGRNRHDHTKYMTAKMKNPHTLSAGHGYHSWFGNQYGLPIQVCTAWVFVGDAGYFVSAGPVCATVQ